MHFALYKSTVAMEKNFFVADLAIFSCCMHGHGLDRFGEVYASVDWDKGPSGQCVHKTCELTLWNAKKLNRPREGKKRKRPVASLHQHLKLLPQVIQKLHLPSGCARV